MASSDTVKISGTGPVGIGQLERDLADRIDGEGVIDVSPGGDAYQAEEQ